MLNGRSTALQAIAGHNLKGMLAVVTGSGGIGRQAALALAAAGAEVVLGGRRAADLRQAEAEIGAAVPGAIVEGLPLDLESPASVEHFAQAVLGRERPVSFLVANAGVAACPQSFNELGVERHFATNVLGHALLTALLVPALRAASAARIVCLTSSAHQFTPVVFDDISFRHRLYDRLIAYAQSKTGCVLLAVHLGSQLAQYGITVHAVHPGLVQTDIMRHLSDEDRLSIATMQAGIQPKTAAQGAATVIWAAVEPRLAGQPTRYLEDCSVAPLIDFPMGNDYGYGVMAHALDFEAAAQLWAWAEGTLSRDLNL
ncbi:SDR family NAD(P)-dependent oxidoreductase [Novosphingobium colocasiae]|uniref:Oxidoreductase n=1 Tax=Novosphingobium colocasiae TaxID=1256513 RepID=A0A918PLX6_9SPHN|nr:SDR family NAD(P)-dependent oxidoreductase [Novosphingobium colocasiae]GGZ15120.1 oxidoreductase [Novosphingobium colocasiae]